MTQRVLHLFSGESRWNEIKVTRKLKAVTNHASLTKLIDGAAVGVWVIPRSASDLSLIAHFLSGVGDRVHYVEFDAQETELQWPHGAIKILFSAVQRIIVTEVLDLSFRNPHFGILNRRAMPFNLEVMKREPPK